MSLAPKTETAQSGLDAGGAAVVTTSAGALTVSEAVLATGNLMLSAGTGNLALDASVTSTSGAISLAAAGDLLQGADIAAQGAGKSVALAAIGNVQMAAGRHAAGQRQRQRVHRGRRPVGPEPRERRDGQRGGQRRDHHRRRHRH
ncbi:hypothetical protein HK414_15940 [Ramlibacter terrae]|uniref:Uncharacterized protein n=1 Tax=Ramlibacter terrae TaxID=2732511 RepID=A0ABX6P5I6_9BURK|nr:hypothetical protein HK414_15940 [Ramlibacter terrae]